MVEAIDTYDNLLKIKPDYSNALNQKANALDKLDKKMKHQKFIK